MTVNELIQKVMDHCYSSGRRIYIDPTEFEGVSLTRIKLLGARISDKELEKVKSEYIGKVVEDKKVYALDRNKYSTGGEYTSVQDVCIYLR